MKQILIFFILLVLYSFADYRSNKLENGKYKVEIINRKLINNEDSITQVQIIYEIFSIQINDTLFTKIYESGDTIFGKIKYFGENVFIMKDNTAETDTTEVGKLILKSFGEPCIEILDKHNDTIFFRTRHLHNLHITINEGKFIKQNN